MFFHARSPNAALLAAKHRSRMLPIYAVRAVRTPDEMIIATEIEPAKQFSKKVIQSALASSGSCAVFQMHDISDQLVRVVS
jgi:hypothetical protein